MGKKEYTDGYYLIAPPLPFSTWASYFPLEDLRGNSKTAVYILFEEVFLFTHFGLLVYRSIGLLSSVYKFRSRNFILINQIHLLGLHTVFFAELFLEAHAG